MENGGEKVDLKKLKEIGKDVEQTQTKSNLQPKVLAILRQNTKNNEAMTQKQIADILGEKLARTIRPQHVRSILLSLRKKNAVMRRILPQPDENGNSHFWYATK